MSKYIQVELERQLLMVETIIYNDNLLQPKQISAALPIYSIVSIAQHEMYKTKAYYGHTIVVPLT